MRVLLSARRDPAGHSGEAFSASRVDYAELPEVLACIHGPTDDRDVRRRSDNGPGFDADLAWRSCSYGRRACMGEPARPKDMVLWVRNAPGAGKIISITNSR